MDLQFLIQLLKELEDQIKLGPRKNWTNNEYQKLSEIIFNKSAIRISSSTIRRLYNKRSKFSSNPQRETLNALSITLGYDNWAGYISKQNKSEDKNHTNRKNIKNIRRFIGVGILIIVVVLISYLTFKITPDYSDIVFEGNYLVSNNVPHTVIVKYDLGKHKNDFFIDWDDIQPDGTEPDEPILLDNKKNIITYTYYNKRNCNIVLLDKYENQIKKLSTQINTNGWECFVLQNDDLFMVDSNNFEFNDRLDASTYIKNEESIKKDTDYRLFYWNIGNFRFADSLLFTFDVEPQFTTKKVQCNHLQVEILSTNNYIMLTLMQTGCENLNSIRLADKIMYGTDYDLSALSIPNNHKTSIEIKVQNKMLSISNNNKKAFSVELNQDLGIVDGIRFEFKGNGIIYNSAIQQLNTH